MSHPNEELVRRGYGAFAAGDFPTLMSLFHEDVVWRIPGRNALSGEYRGAGEILELFGRFVEMSQGSLRFEIHDVIANDDHAVALVQARARRNGHDLHDRSIHVMHLRDGKLTEFWSYPAAQHDVDGFWS